MEYNFKNYLDLAGENKLDTKPVIPGGLPFLVGSLCSLIVFNFISTSGNSFCILTNASFSLSIRFSIDFFCLLFAAPDNSSVNL